MLVSGGPGSRPVERVRRRREAEPRRVSQQVLLTEEERDQLRARAGELGVSVPRLLVESALSGVKTPAQRRSWMTELFELRRLLATVANNVNQLARVANTSEELPVSGRLSRTFGEVDGLAAELREWMRARR
jgi:Bacterial mobilisation protein (MobC)